MVFDGVIEDSFEAGRTATEALQHIGNSARDQYAQITLSEVTDYNIADAITDRGFTGLDRSTLFSFSEPDSWDLRDSDQSGATVGLEIIGWGSFVNEWFWFTGDYRPQGTSGTIQLILHGAVTNNATFEWSAITQLSNGTALFIRALDSESGTPPALGGTFTANLTDDGNPIAGKQILLHTNQIQDITQMFRITANTATNIFNQIEEFAVGGNTSGTNSSYTLTDPSGSETMSLTAYSREPLASISSRIRDAVNDTEDTPTDFTANVLDGEILLKPESGLVSTDWSIAINHGSGNDGTIAYELSRPNSFVPSSGQMSFPDNIYNTENGEVE